MGGLETKLEQARRHVFVGRQIVERQRELIGRMEGKRLDTVNAMALLACFERTQAIFEDDLKALGAATADLADTT